MSADPAVPGNIDWRVSRACDSSGCVGVARQGDLVIVGDTSLPGSPVYRFTRMEWDAFIAGVKQDFALAGRFTLTSEAAGAQAPAASIHS